MIIRTTKTLNHLLKFFTEHRDVEILFSTSDPTSEDFVKIKASCISGIFVETTPNEKSIKLEFVEKN